MQLKGILLCLFTFISPMIYANNIIILMSDHQQIHQEMAAAIRLHTGATSLTLPYQELLDIDMTHGQHTILSVGARACDAAFENISQHDVLICTLIPAQTFTELSVKHEKKLTHSNSVTSVFMDQPIQRQLLLAQLIAPDASTIGTVFGRNSVSARTEFETFAKTLGLTPEHAYLDDLHNPVQVLTPLIQRSDIFLALPDSATFNRNVARWSLYITLRNKVPIIGFSANYAEAGAVVSLYSTVDQLAAQAYEALSRYNQYQQLPAPSYPHDFTIDVNRPAVRTLRMNLPDSETLRQQLKASDQ